MAVALAAAVAVVVTAGAALQASVGVGFGVLAAPLLGILAPELVPGPLLLLSLVLAAMTTTREIRSVAVQELGLAMTGRIAGTAAAGTAIALLPLPVFGSVFALMILAAIGLSLTSWHLLPTPRNLLVAGLLSGFMGTITSVGGPPMAMVYQNMPGPKVRATLGAFLMLGAGFSLVTLALVGRFTAAQAASSAWLVPPTLLGFVASRYLLKHVDKSRKGVKTAVLAISAVAALTLLLKPLF
ncbi:MAG TPA: TSUP family transporter [Ramlibacter sp.]|nr:TSUP family transporter [Ramlibacter sp.]